MKIVWTRQARTDRRAIFTYIQQDNSMAAAAMDDQFVKAVEQLSRHPLSGRMGRVHNTRELLAHPSYLMIYDVTADTICILTIVHTARQWPPE